MSEAYRRFKLLRRDPEWPIFVRNVTDGVIRMRVTYRRDWKWWQNHPLKDYRHLVIPPGQLIELRYFLTEEFLHSNLDLPWYLETEKLVVENKYICRNCYPDECATLKPLYEESRLITRMANDRWRAVMATRRKQ